MWFMAWNKVKKCSRFSLWFQSLEFDEIEFIMAVNKISSFLDISQCGIEFLIGWYVAGFQLIHSSSQVLLKLIQFSLETIIKIFYENILSCLK